MREEDRVTNLEQEAKRNTISSQDKKQPCMKKSRPRYKG